VVTRIAQPRAELLEVADDVDFFTMVESTGQPHRR
jgi:hypothetical protein